jgi:O-antigen/teichoic acid export membrane protein
MNPQDDKQRTGTLQNISWLSAAEYLSEAFYFVRGTVLAALIGPQAFGIWSSMRIVARFLPYAPLGSLQGMLRSQERFLAVGATKFGLSVSTLLFGVFAAWRFGLLGFLVAVGCSYVLVRFLTTRKCLYAHYSSEPRRDNWSQRVSRSSWQKYFSRCYTTWTKF